MKRPIDRNDVVRIESGPCKGRTGVVNRRDDTTGMVNVFQRGEWIGIWFFETELKRIGRTKEET